MAAHRKSGSLRERKAITCRSSGQAAETIMQGDRDSQDFIFDKVARCMAKVGITE
jgi:hypothetical protein